MQDEALTLGASMSNTASPLLAGSEPEAWPALPIRATDGGSAARGRSPASGDRGRGRGGDVHVNDVDEVGDTVLATTTTATTTTTPADEHASSPSSSDAPPATSLHSGAPETSKHSTHGPPPVRLNLLSLPRNDSDGSHHTGRPPRTPPAWTGAGVRPCPDCTFHNAPDMVRCVACSCPLPPPPSSVFSAAFPLPTCDAVMQCSGDGTGVLGVAKSIAADGAARTYAGAAATPVPRRASLSGGGGGSRTVPSSSSSAAAAAAAAAEAAFEAERSRPVDDLPTSLWDQLASSGEIIFRMKGHAYAFSGLWHGGRPVYHDVDDRRTEVFYGGDRDRNWHNNGVSVSSP